MITAYCRGLLTIWWPRWKQFTLFVRWFLPIYLHFQAKSVIDLTTNSTRTIKPDLSTITFVISASFALNRFDSLTIEPYKPRLRYFDTIFQVVLQIIYVDLSIRFVFIPIYYLIRTLCVKGILAFFIHHCLPFLYIFDSYFPVARLIHLSKTEAASELLRTILSFSLLGWSIFLSKFHIQILATFIKIKSFAEFLITPILRIARNRKPRNCYLF